MTKWLRHRTPVQVIAACVGAGAALIAILALVPDTRARIEWGTAPTWVTVGAGVVALFGVGVSYQSLAANLQHRRDDETSLARLLVIRDGGIKRIRGQNAGADFYVTLQNTSDHTFSNIRLVGIVYNGEQCSRQPEHRADERMQDGRNVLPPGGTVGFRRRLPPGADPETSSTPPQIRFSYTDPNGRRWDRLNISEPRRIYEAPPSAAQLDAFERAVGSMSDERG